MSLGLVQDNIQLGLPANDNSKNAAVVCVKVKWKSATAVTTGYTHKVKVPSNASERRVVGIANQMTRIFLQDGLVRVAPRDKQREITIRIKWGGDDTRQNPWTGVLPPHANELDIHQLTEQAYQELRSRLLSPLSPPTCEKVS